MLADGHAGRVIHERVFESETQVESDRPPAIRTRMCDDERLSQEQGRPRGAKTQVIMPEDVTPLHELKQSTGRWRAQNRYSKFRMIGSGDSLCNNDDGVAHRGKLLGQQTADGFDSAKTRSEGVR